MDSEFAADRTFLREMELVAWQVNFGEDYTDTGRQTVHFNDGNAVGSSRTRGADGEHAKHAILLDLDHSAARVIPSSTPGHSHLVIDTHLAWADYCELLVLLARAGVIEHGYANLSIERGQAFIRMPGVKKEGSQYVGGVEFDDIPPMDEEPF